MAPVMRSVETPSMNKDGIYFGSYTGMTAALMAGEGIYGKRYLLSEPEYGALAESLGTDYKIMGLYFKFFTCCRWAQPAIAGCLSLKKKHEFLMDDIKAIRLLTFQAAADLYSEEPENTEEAQYSIVYPIAAAVRYGELGPREVGEECLHDPATHALMKKITFGVKEEFEARFPAERLCEVEIELLDGRVFNSGIMCPPGEPEDHISIDTICTKFRSITKGCFDRDRAAFILKALRTPKDDFTVRDLVRLIEDE